MIQKAVVKRLLTGELAEIEVQRQGACGHDCAKCGGCGAPMERIQAQAVNKIGALAGETVTIEGDSKQVLGAAAIVYAIPIVLFFVGFALMRILGQGEAVAAAIGIVGFCLGIFGAVRYNHFMHRRGMTPFVIIKRS